MSRRHSTLSVLRLALPSCRRNLWRTSKLQTSSMFQLYSEMCVSSLLVVPGMPVYSHRDCACDCRRAMSRHHSCTSLLRRVSRKPRELADQHLRQHLLVRPVHPSSVKYFVSAGIRASFSHFLARVTLAVCLLSEQLPEPHGSLLFCSTDRYLLRRYPVSSPAPADFRPAMSTIITDGLFVCAVRNVTASLANAKTAGLRQSSSYYYL